MAAKRKSARAGSKRRSEAKQALAGIEKAHKSLQLNLKKLKTSLGGSFIAGGGSFTSGGGSFTAGGGSFKS